MILKALYDYYYRKSTSSDALAPEGMENRAIMFLIVLDSNGHFIRLENTADENGNAKHYWVLRQKRSSNIVPRVLYDNAEYVLGIKFNKSKSQWESSEKSEEKRKAFVNTCRELEALYPENDEFRAVCRFYDNFETEKQNIITDSSWAEVCNKPNDDFSFLLNGRTDIVASNPDIDKYNEKSRESDSSGENYVCLITGKKGPVVRVVKSSINIQGSKKNAALTSFQVNSGYDSYEKKQCYNSPMSLEAQAAYMGALEYLLRPDSQNKFIIGNRTFVFWASSMSRAAQEAEKDIFALFGFSDSEKDDPDYKIENVRKSLEAIYSGKIPCESEDRFFILGLAPNAARIYVVYWNECPLKEFAHRIVRHFDDMEIIDTRKNKKPYSNIDSILGSTTVSGMSKDATPNLPEAVMRSILQGTPYPYSLYMACLNRIHAKQIQSKQNQNPSRTTGGRGAIGTARLTQSKQNQDQSITSYAIIKAYLSRLQNNKLKELSPMLDKTNSNIGYLCGRLFATLLRQQEQSSNWQNSSIRTRYMNAASTTPATVFPTIMNLAMHHAEKLTLGSRIHYDKLISEIMSKIPVEGFPPHLDLNDQGRFMVGYYHQYQDFFSAKNEEIDTNN